MLLYVFIESIGPVTVCIIDCIPSNYIHDMKYNYGSRIVYDLRWRQPV